MKQRKMSTNELSSGQQNNNLNGNACKRGYWKLNSSWFNNNFWFGNVYLSVTHNKQLDCIETSSFRINCYHTL